MRYRVKPDSVAGAPCVIVYDGDRPILTIWDDEKQIAHAARFFAELTEKDEGELANLVTSIRSLGGSREQLMGAVETYLKEKLNEVYRKEV